MLSGLLKFRLELTESYTVYPADFRCQRASRSGRVRDVPPLPSSFDLAGLVTFRHQAMRPLRRLTASLLGLRLLRISGEETCEFVVRSDHLVPVPVPTGDFVRTAVRFDLCGYYFGVLFRHNSRQMSSTISGYCGRCHSNSARAWTRASP